MKTPFRCTLTTSATEKSDYKRKKFSSADVFIETLLGRGHIAGVKGGSGIVAATFKYGVRIESKGVDTVTGVILDVDGKFKHEGKSVHEPVDPDAFLANLPWRGVAHTSHSHHPDLPKYRVILPLAEELTPAEFTRLWHWIFERVDRKCDAACKNPDRMFYLPRCPAEMLPHAWMRELHGPLLSLKDVPDDFVVPVHVASPANTRRKRQGAHFAPPEARRSWTPGETLVEKFLSLPVVVWAIENPYDVSREVWRGMATNLAAIAVDDESALEAAKAAFHQVSEPDTERYNWGVCEKTFNDAIRSADQYGPMTYSTMMQNGAPDDLCMDERGGKSPIAHARNLSYRERKTSPKAEAPSNSPPVEGAPTVPADTPTADTPNEPPPPSVASTSGPPPSVYEADHLYSMLHNKWRMRDTTGEWTDPVYTTEAINQKLLSRGYSKKSIEGWRANTIAYEVEQMVFDSKDRVVERRGLTIFNTFYTPTLPPVAGKWDDLYAVILNLVGGDRAAVDYVLDWLALPLQSLMGRLNNGQARAYKMGTALVFHGDQGSGKGTFGELMEALYSSRHFVEIGQNFLDGRFNGELENKLFVVANEVVSSSNRSAETANKIKPWITDSKISLEAKFGGTNMIPNFFNIVFTSNDERPVVVERGDRRYSVFNSEKLDETLAARVHADLRGPRAQVAALFEHLLNRQVNIRYGHLYKNKDREQMQLASASSEEKFVYEIKWDGWFAVSQPWVSTAPNGQEREAVINGAVPSDALQAVYKYYCTSHGIRMKGGSALGQALNRAIPAVQQGRVRSGGIMRRVWLNVPMHPPDTEGEVLPIKAEPELAPVPPDDIDDIGTA